MTNAHLSPAVPLFLYDSYVDFLRDWTAKAKHQGLSQKAFLKKTGIKSAAFLSDILAGRKVMGKTSIEPFVSAMALEGNEAEYFRLLVKKDTTKFPEERTQIFNQLMDLRKHNVSVILEDEKLEYFTSWKYTIIREYILAKGLVKSPKEISRSLINLKLGKIEVEKALEKLESWNLIVFDVKAEGYRIAQEENLTYKNPPHTLVKDIKREMIEASIHAMEMLPKEKRDVSMSVRGLSQKNYLKMCDKINALRQEFLALENTEGEPDRVSILNIQFFPVAEISNEKKPGDSV